MDKNSFITIYEASKFLCLSKSSIYKLVAKGKIKAFKPNGGKLYFRKIDLERFILNRRFNSKSETNG